MSKTMVFGNSDLSYVGSVSYCREGVGIVDLYRIKNRTAFQIPKIKVTYSKITCIS